MVSLHNLLIREQAGTESQCIFILSPNPNSNPEMYELKVQSPKDRNIWIESIRYIRFLFIDSIKTNNPYICSAAVLSCRSENNVTNEYLNEELQLSMAEAKQSMLKDLIGKCFLHV